MTEAAAGAGGGRTLAGPERREGRLTKDLEENLLHLREVLGIGESFDVVERRLEIGGRAVAVIFVDGLVKDDVMTDVLRHLLRLERADLAPLALEAVLRRHLPHIEVSRAGTFSEVIDSVLSGPVALIIDGADEAVIIDARAYPAREPEEPELERVLRGSRDGFVETIVFNTALIRRRVRDANLRVELIPVGKRSKTDVALIYIKDIANSDLVDTVRRRLKGIEVAGIPMAEKTVEEFLLGRKAWWNPFPLIRLTERPDVAAVHLFEGHVLVAVDTSPSVIMLPTTFFHHIQHAEEFREDVLAGVYIRLVRFAAIFLSWVGPPLWLALVHDLPLLPAGFAFLGPKEPGVVPLGLQFFMAEVGIDLIRLALIHAPSALATALGFIGAILLGDIAAKVGLFANETILYIALAALGTFATPSFEFALAVRLSRLVFVVLAALFGLVGLGVGLAVQAVLLLTMKCFGVPYLWPLVPFNGQALWAVVVRQPVPLRKARPSVLRTRKPETGVSGATGTEDEAGGEDRG